MEGNHIVNIAKHLSSIRDVISMLQVNKKYYEGIISLTTTPFYKEKNVKKEMEIFSNATTITCDYISIPLSHHKLCIIDSDCHCPRSSLLEASKRIEKITMNTSDYNKNYWKAMPLKYLIINCVEELNGAKNSQNPYPFKETIKLPNCVVRIICDICQLDNVINNIPKHSSCKNLIVEVHNGPIITFYRKGEWVFAFRQGFITMHMQDLNPFIESSERYAVENIKIIDFINPEYPSEPCDFTVGLPLQKLILQDLNCPAIKFPDTLVELTISNCSITSLELKQKHLKKVVIEQCADLKSIIISSPLVECEAIYLKALEKLELPSTVQILKLNNSSLPIKSFPDNVRYLSIPTVKQLNQLIIPQHPKELTINSCFIVTLPTLNADKITFFQCTFTNKVFVKAKNVFVSGCYLVSNLQIEADSVSIIGCAALNSSQNNSLISYDANVAKIINISSFGGVNKLIAKKCTELKLTNNSQMNEIDAENVTDLQLIHTNIIKSNFINLKKFDIDNDQLTNNLLMGSGSLTLKKCFFDPKILDGLDNLIDITLNEVVVDSISINSCRGIRLYNCLSLKKVSVKQAQTIILFNLPVLEEVLLPKSVRNLVINNCPNIKNVVFPTTTDVSVDFQGSFQAFENIQIKNVQGQTLVVDSKHVRLEDITNSSVILGESVETVNGVGLNNVKFENLKESNITSFDLAMSNNMNLLFPNSLILVNIVGCQSVVCPNINSCEKVPEQIRIDYSSNKYEEIPKNGCVIC